MPIIITRFTKDPKDGILSKHIYLDAAGKLVSDGSACFMLDGTAVAVEVKNLNDFAEVIEGCSLQDAITMGRLVNPPADGKPVQVTTKSRLNGQPNTIARTKDHLHFEPGQPGFMLLDLDLKDLPRAAADRLKEVGGYDKALAKVAPDLANAGSVIRASTSSGLSNGNVLYPMSGGKHQYVPVKDAADIPRATKVLHKRLILAGFGGLVVGEHGQFLERSIVDRIVGSAERLVFEAPPRVDPPLVQDKKARKPEVREGEVIDTRKVIPDLTAAETAEFNNLIANARRVLMPEALAKRKASDDVLVARTVKATGEPEQKVRHRIEQRHHNNLSPEIIVEFDDAAIGSITVATILADTAKYIGETLADPLEGVAYGRCKAMVMRGRDGGTIIHSFAHGGAVYRLCHDEVTLDNLITAADPKHIVDTFLEHRHSPLIGAVAMARLRKKVATLAGIGLRDFDRAAKADNSQQQARKAKAKAAAAPPDDRYVLEAPGGGDEFGPTVNAIDRVLSQVDALEPPMRNMQMGLVKIVEEAAVGLHLLPDEDEDDGDDGEPTDKKDKVFIPAPKEPRIKVRDADEVTLLVEQHVALIVRDKEGEICGKRRLDQSFARVLGAKMEKLSEVPIVKGVSIMPVVQVSKTGKTHVIAENGLDQKSGILFRIHPAVIDAFPKPEECTAEAAEAAFRFLADEWFCDVAADAGGKATLVTLALHGIQRFDFGERPCFFVTAGQRGGGKTTVVNMISEALFGRRASASPWSSSEEEREKVLLSVTIAGTAMLVFDNIARGSTIASSVLEASLTAGTKSGRILGTNEYVNLPCNFLTVFTGNSIRPADELAARSAVIEIKTDRHDPENRVFRHENPIAWTQANRHHILRALYTILLAPRPKSKTLKTRFKKWWFNVGFPVELASRGAVDFGALFADSEVEDEVANAAGDLILELHKDFGTNIFTSSDLTVLLRPEPPGKDASTSFDSAAYDAHHERASKLRGLVDLASGKPFPKGEMSIELTAHRLKAICGRTVLIEGFGETRITKTYDRYARTLEWQIERLGVIDAALQAEMDVLFG